MSVQSNSGLMHRNKPYPLFDQLVGMGFLPIQLPATAAGRTTAAHQRTVEHQAAACHIETPHPAVTATASNSGVVLMPDDISPDRVTAIAAAARVPLAPIEAERIARAVAPTAARFAAAKIDLALETEPASFAAVQRREIGR